MKKKLLASLLVSSAVVGASLAPLSAQAVTTGNTPVQVEFGGGKLPDGNGDVGGIDPDLNGSNSDFDLLYIPQKFIFPKTAISADLSALSTGIASRYGVGDLRGTKEGWHVTAAIPEMANGEEKLTGIFSFTQNEGYIVTYDEEKNVFKPDLTSDFNSNPAAPEFLASRSITIGGGAVLLSNAVSGKGQGMWGFTMTNKYLNITTPYQQLKAGTYSGAVTWNLVSGPSI
ncbi:WxL domain-containing protein [Enterococcus faecalis]|uniref:WxL domain-containing protein n=1 Tax=Enterococcus faecalis TaxID=1351 RepID=UPI00076FBEC6|nr:WxL domain-containing protein [Enterococcus faecalis]